MSLVRRFVGALSGIVLFAAASLTHAQDLLMVRSAQQFPEAMVTLQNSIRDHGYELSRVQRVDIGLTSSGYTTDKYRVVFFGKRSEVEKLKKEHPELIPYLPLKVAIFAEEDQTLVVASDPVRFAEFFPSQDLEVQFHRWASDLHSIMDDVRTAQ
jgi:uncharacterized protein (DUF302 family)